LLNHHLITLGLNLYQDHEIIDHPLKTLDKANFCIAKP